MGHQPQFVNRDIIAQLDFHPSTTTTSRYKSAVSRASENKSVLIFTSCIAV